MPELLQIGLQLTVFGMGLVFLLLALLWGGMALMLRLDRPPAPPPTASAAPPENQAASSLDPDKLPAAEEHARKAAELAGADPAMLRTLARVYAAAAKLCEAEETLVRARELKNENDSLAREIAADLADVRRLLAAGKPDEGRLP